MSKPLWKKFLLGFLGLNAIAVTTIYLSDSMLSISSHRGLNQEEYIHDNSEYRFIDPELAYGVLSQLETISDQDPNSGFGTGVKNYKPYLSIQTEDDYCDKRRAFFVESTESLFKEMTFMSDLAHRTFVRSKVLSVIGNDTQSHIALPLPDLPLHRISPAISNFYTRMSLFRDKNITRHFACISQSSNQIPGEQALDTKYLLANAVVNYAKQFEDRPQCFSFNKFFPKTYRLYDEEECNTFFEIFNSPAYQAEKEEKKIVYIKKIGKGAHMGSGVFLVNDEEEASLRQVYANGAKCGKVKDVNLVQNYIHKPMLIYGRKFDFRAYVFIASTNPLIAYYHDGSLRISLMDYDIASNDKKTLLTNIKLNHEIYANASQGVLYKGMDEEQLRSAQQWSFEMFQNYLLETGQVKDLAWFDDYLRPQFKKAMIHMLRFGLVSPFVNSAVYQHYGIDFMLDEDLNLWFIEANSAPGMDKLSKPVENFLTKLLTDEMEIVMGLLRSRMKRVINYVNYLIMDGSVTRDSEGKVVIKNLEAAKLMFNKLTQNYFEEEFEPSPSNGFQKIIDGNYKGADKYLGFVSEECI